MNNPDLIALADEIARAQGPSADLDQKIGVAVRNIGRDGTPIIGIANCPRYSSSVDAALQLVPEGFDRWAVTGRNSATVGKAGYVTTAKDWVYAATPALALCAAALRAKAVQP